jgi:hypothetical protein
LEYVIEIHFVYALLNSVGWLDESSELPVFKYWGIIDEFNYLIEVFWVAICGDYEFGFVVGLFWKDYYKINFLAIVAEVFVHPKAYCYLVSGSFVDKVFDGLIVVLEPAPEGVNFFHFDLGFKY